MLVERAEVASPPARVVRTQRIVLVASLSAAFARATSISGLVVPIAKAVRLSLLLSYLLYPRAAMLLRPTLAVGH
eukprot:8392312-Lingulodinium_polyedra.AAC.1